MTRLARPAALLVLLLAGCPSGGPGVQLEQPANLTVQAGADRDEAAVSWDAVAGATAYDLQYRLDGGAWGDLAVTVPAGPAGVRMGGSLRILNAPELFTVEVRVRARHGASASTYSEPAGWTRPPLPPAALESLQALQSKAAFIPLQPGVNTATAAALGMNGTLNPDACRTLFVAAADEDGSLQNGWLLVHADKAARVSEEDSETPYMTRRAMDFIAEAEDDGRPWCLHLSYIKPHWPYIAPEPYASMYGPDDVKPAIRSQQERAEAHPVFAAYMDMRYSRNMSRDEAREKVIPTYMGLIKQIDDQMGVLMRFLETRGLLDTTMIVFTSDHGDYLGDHWMGEKDLFHEQSAKIPLIVIDPSPAADPTRGTVSDALVEAIDLAPTFLDYFGATPPDHILEGRSLLPLLHGAKTADWRRVVFSEYDYAMQDVRVMLNQPIERCRLFMVFDGRWKFIHASGFRPMLYDLETDPQEFVDRGADPSCADIVARLQSELFDWALHPRMHITTPNAKIAAYAAQQLQVKNGVLIGIWDEAELGVIREKIGLKPVG